MKRFLFITVVLTMSTTLLAQSYHPRAAFTTDTPMVHDPVMANEDSTYHIFATGMGIQQMTSKDRKNWTVLPDPVMTVIPKWTRDSVPGFRHHVWAPDVIKWHNRWWLAYSCSTFGKNGSAIGLLSSTSLSSSLWEDEGCIVTSREGRDNWNAIDPNFVIDDNDQPWLVWGSFWDGIQPDAKAALPVNPNPPKNPTSDFAGPNAIEAPFILKHDGWYFLFVSWDYCCQGSKSTYQVAVGRSKTVEGPYYDPQGIDMRYGGGKLFLKGDKKAYEAAGHCAAYTIDGQDIFICHGYSIAHKGASILIQCPIQWTADGWPQIDL